MIGFGAYAGGVRVVIPRHHRLGYPATVHCEPSVLSISAGSGFAAVRCTEKSHG